MSPRLLYFVLRKLSNAARFKPFRNLNRLDAAGIFRMLDAQRAHFCAFANQRVATLDHMPLRDGFAAPGFDAGVNLKPLAIRGADFELRVNLKQWRADDAFCFDQLTPRGYAALHEKIQ